MSSQLKLRRGSSAAHTTFIGAQGEVTVDTDTNALVVHNGATPGGFPAPTKTELAAGTVPLGFTTADVTPVETTVEAQLKKAVTGNAGRSHFQIGCIPRCTAGVFALIDDAGHHPLNVASVSQPDDYAIRITYAMPATKINSFVIAQDSELAPYGVHVGGDVGLTLANALAFASLGAHVTGTNVTTSAIHGTSVTAAASADVLSITHEASVDGDAPVVALVSGTPANMKHVAAGYNNNVVTVKAVGDLAGFVSYNGAAWVVSLTDCDVTEAAFVPTFTAGFNLKLAHVLLNDYNVQITGHGGAHIPQIMAAALDSFEVGFFDFAGTKITVPATTMKIWFRRKNLVKCALPAALGVLVRRGNVAVKSANFSAIPGNNFWVSGTMEG